MKTKTKIRNKGHEMINVWLRQIDINEKHRRIADDILTWYKDRCQQDEPTITSE